MGFSVYVVMYNVQTVSLNFPTPALVNGKLVVIVYQYLTKKIIAVRLNFLSTKGHTKAYQTFVELLWTGHNGKDNGFHR